jgi:CRP/FNR family transcriptional regulator
MSVVDPLAILSRHAYFTPLPATILAAVGRRVLTRTYAKGALVYAEGDASHGLYLVASGSVRVFKSSEAGKEQDLHHIGAGESFGDAAAFDGEPTIANAEAMEATVVLVVPRDALRDLMLKHPEIALSVTQVLASRVRDLSALAAELALRHVESRIARVLLRLPSSDGVVTLPARHELAAMVGTVREVATRGLRQLQQAGLIEVEPRRRVRIRDRRALEALTGTLPSLAR